MPLPSFFQSQHNVKPVGAQPIFNPAPNTVSPVKVPPKTASAPAGAQTIPVSGGAHVTNTRKAALERDKSVKMMPTVRVSSQQMLIRAPYPNAPKVHHGIASPTPSDGRNRVQIELDRNSIGGQLDSTDQGKRSPGLKQVPMSSIVGQINNLYLTGSIYQGGFGEGSHAPYGNACEVSTH